MPGARHVASETLQNVVAGSAGTHILIIVGAGVILRGAPNHPYPMITLIPDIRVFEGEAASRQSRRMTSPEGPVRPGQAQERDDGED